MPKQINSLKQRQIPYEILDLVEAIIFSSLEPVPYSVLLKRVNNYYEKNNLNPVDYKQIEGAIIEVKEIYQSRAVNLVKVSSGFCFEVNQRFSELLKPTIQERNSRPSKAYLETLTLIAYKQPLTRAEIEAVRGVSVSSNIIRDLLERNWIEIAGHKNTPGFPALYQTTQHFLDSFHLSSIDDLPKIDFSALSDDNKIET